MAFEPKQEVVQAFARWLYGQEHPEVPDWEAEERALEKRPAVRPIAVVRTVYEGRARQMLIAARSNSGSGG